MTPYDEELARRLWRRYELIHDVTYFSPIFANGELAGRFISVAYVVAYMLFGAGALHPSMRRLLVRPPSES